MSTAMANLAILPRLPVVRCDHPSIRHQLPSAAEAVPLSANWVSLDDDLVANAGVLHHGLGGRLAHASAVTLAFALVLVSSVLLLLLSCKSLWLTDRE
jgi:hypothetical protein